MKSAKKVAIFDFDGTLGDVIPLMRQIYVDFALRKGYPELTDEIFQQLRKGTLKEIIKWIGVKPWQVPGLMKEGRSLFHVQSKDVLLFPGVTKLINQLHNDGWDMYILSSNSTVTIHEVLERNSIHQHIHILKRPSLFGKATSIKKLLNNHKYAKPNVWMIGDEVRDVEAGNKAGVKSMGVTWGLQDESILTLHHPTALVRSVDEIYTTLTTS